ncbi:late embryogenis abundant protein 2-like [Nicotiana tabacum]|uniref:Late embryogenis abundant protein 2-like n=2 Tax=Nicotiana TaxID=4085 RepID=A0A1S4BVG8_TOBAC|nr:PREDICTED: late embryogenesis abundant protein Lea5-like [Nicotiana sylvestris]XP_016492877.1 PREDICTED: protein SENESCENCE-ASSOCIATED GENE 21, mitochondrial-like [Nicotiana tabacum]
MARSLSNSKLYSTFVTDRLSLGVTRKGYAVAEVAGGRGGVAQSNMMIMMKKGGEESAPWVPDPVTGYYRPENQANQIDAVELRRMLLNNSTRGH